MLPTKELSLDYLLKWTGIQGGECLWSLFPLNDAFLARVSMMASERCTMVYFQNFQYRKCIYNFLHIF
jgi:hypothetical protein